MMLIFWGGLALAAAKVVARVVVVVVVVPAIFVGYFGLWYPISKRGFPSK